MGKQLHFHRLAHLLPRQFQPLLFVLLNLAARRPHQVENFRPAVRIPCNTSSVGIPRSITQTRRARPYCAQFCSRNPRSVVRSEVLPASTS